MSGFVGSGFALVLGLSLVGAPAAGFYCDPGGAPLVNHAPTGAAIASTGAATAAQAIDGSSATAWQGATSGSSVFTWQAPADLFAERIHVSGVLGSLFLEVLDASDAVLAGGSVTPIAGSPLVGIFDTQGLTLRKLRLTLTPGVLPPPFPSLPALWIFELRVESAGVPPAPPLPGPGPEELTLTATFQGVGDAPGGAFLSRARAVSPDGRLATGESERAPGKLAAFRFADGALTPLGFTAELRHTPPLNPIPDTCATTDASRGLAASNGGVVAGEVCQASRCAPARFGGGTPEVLQPGFPTAGPSFWTTGSATDLLPDASQSFGSYAVADPQTLDPRGFAFRHAGGAFTTLAQGFPGDASPTHASPDGGCAVGATSSAGIVSTFGSGVCSALPDEDATDVSAGGVHVVGRSAGLAARGALVLGDLPGGADASLALGVSDDGDTVVGWGSTAAGQEAFVWTAAGGMERLADRLTSEGVDLAAWTLAQATGVSASGRTIVGFGTNPSGQTEGFVATLAATPRVPALGLPASALAALLLAAAGLLALRRRGAPG